MLSARLLPAMPIRKHQAFIVVLSKLEVIGMKLSNRAMPLFVVIVIFVLAAIAIASPLLFPSAKAGTHSDYAQSGKNTAPTLKGKIKNRIENEGGKGSGDKYKSE